MSKNETLQAVSKIFLPYKKNIIIINIITIFASVGSFANPWLTMLLIDDGIMESNFVKTFLIIGAIFSVYIGQQFISMIQFHYYRDISVKVPYDLNLQASKHILSVRIKYFKERNFSSVMAEIFQDIANISSLTGTQFLTSFVTLVKILAGILALLLIRWQLALLMISIIPIKLIISSFMFKRQEKLYKVIMKVQSDFSKWLGDSSSGIVEIKIWGLINEKLEDLSSILKESNKTKSKIMLYGYIESTFGIFLSIVLTCILYLYGMILISNDTMTIGMLVSFIAYSSLVFEPINLVSYLITQLSSTKPALERFLTFLNTESEKDHVNAMTLDDSSNIEQISFNNVSLIYDEEKALDQVSFTIDKGERVAIIGLNGSGKSSIINLLLRFYEPTEGVIKLNERDIQLYTMTSYRSIWSLMAQKNYLFNDSINNNINISCNLSAEDVKKSCLQAGAYAFIERLPERFETSVGFNGAKLSGGERQKIALARTLAKNNSKILVLDEATSSFDFYSEQIFNREVLKSSKYGMTIIITHRPEILKIIDKIIYLENGKVVKIGTFDELFVLDNFRDKIAEFQMEVK